MQIKAADNKHGEVAELTALLARRDLQRSTRELRSNRKAANAKTLRQLEDTLALINEVRVTVEAAGRFADRQFAQEAG